MENLNELSSNGSATSRISQTSDQELQVVNKDDVGTLLQALNTTTMLGSNISMDGDHLLEQKQEPHPGQNNDEGENSTISEKAQGAYLTRNMTEHKVQRMGQPEVEAQGNFVSVLSADGVGTSMGMNTSLEANNWFVCSACKGAVNVAACENIGPVQPFLGCFDCTAPKLGE